MRINDSGKGRLVWSARILLFLWLIMTFALIGAKELANYRYAIVIWSLLFGVVLAARVSIASTSRDPKLDAMWQSIDEAQDAINRGVYGIHKYFDSAKWAPPSAFLRAAGLAEFLRTPLVWMTCLGIALVLYLHPIYSEIQFGSASPEDAFIKLPVLAAIQSVFLSVFVMGAVLALLHVLNRKSGQ